VITTKEFPKDLPSIDDEMGSHASRWLESFGVSMFLGERKRDDIEQWVRYPPGEKFGWAKLVEMVGFDSSLLILDVDPELARYKSLAISVMMNKGSEIITVIPSLAAAALPVFEYHLQCAQGEKAQSWDSVRGQLERMMRASQAVTLTLFSDPRRAGEIVMLGLAANSARALYESLLEFSTQIQKSQKVNRPETFSKVLDDIPSAVTASLIHPGVIKIIPE
jgi:hypothetical protein